MRESPLGQLPRQVALRNLILNIDGVLVLVVAREGVNVAIGTL